MQIRRRHAFTLVELLVVMSVVAILAAILMPVFAQAREHARQTVCLSNTRQLAAAALLYATDYDETLPILGTGVDGRGRWMWQIRQYVKHGQVFTCPDVPANRYDGTMWTEQSGYGWAEHLWAKGSGTAAASGYLLSEIGHPAETVMLGDTGYDRIAGWAMYRRPPWNGQADGRPGFYPQFRHHASRVRDFQDPASGTGQLLAMDGLCTFAFLDGHAKALHPGAAFVTAESRDGVPLSGDDRYLLWNRY